MKRFNEIVDDRSLIVVITITSFYGADEPEQTVSEPGRLPFSWHLAWENFEKCPCQKFRHLAKRKFYVYSLTIPHLNETSDLVMYRVKNRVESLGIGLYKKAWQDLPL